MSMNCNSTYNNTWADIHTFNDMMNIEMSRPFISGRVRGRTGWTHKFRVHTYTFSRYHAMQTKAVGT